ncbi:Succinate dehydrogenase/fumarate reductase, flavoprotein subunit [Saccharopolyspora antimicrobica]|uniref:3-oxosteroid 1-dehydrogenase n=1 Tax=Saccharopolyspora antimicrobica TaxID=455193 RepID=A0A1I4VXJ8_9PSEU|nr:FAD-binding protein [Saccharopolyspora antimicrobica]RKT87172.1 succinate dehydrogenase/fumarate reductase flavoprotein subunit [Saccharopolyspora antimicrobica]SFN05726.1 Succinate dehydrogenase/fumarate reductase, flavoprotein subunit [Saccharopolyspora antimicrobica]
MAIWDDECDVLVVGSGGGALTGAYTASREGLSVLVVEATDKFGGTTAYSGGGLWFPGNAVLKRAGDQDTPEEAKTYYRAVVGDRTPRELQDAFLDNGARLVDYLESDDDFEFIVYPWPDYFGSAPGASATGRHIMPMPIPPERIGSLRDQLRPPVGVERAGEPLPELLIGGQALIGRLLLALSKKDSVRLRRGSVCDELLTSDGAVIGAVVEEGGERRRIRARRGVLIASGGFERNQEMRTEHGVPGAARDTMGPAENLGKAIRAGIDVGAGTDLMSEAWWSPGITHPDGTSTFSLWFTGGIFVDGAGERFVNESWPYDRIGRAVLDRLGEGRMALPFWMIYDDREGERPPVRSTSVPMGETGDYVDAGLWFSAGTLAELAEKIGVPADNLERTVARFNGFAAAGADEDFHRGDEPYDRSFAEGGSPLVPIEKGPFHAAAFGLSDLGTKGGLRTDARARVLNTSGEVIPGLYAAGNSMAAVSGTTYPGGGNPIGACMVFSHLAALDMLAR